MRELEGTFGRIYRTGLWGPGSGHGSGLQVTAGYRRLLSDFIAHNGVESVLDYGCGDWSFSRAVDWHGARYLGLDVVDEVVRRNRSAFARPGVEFGVAPDDPSELPAADLLLAKDVLQHLPNDWVADFLRVAVPRYRHALITNDVDPRRPAGTAENADIPVGGWRYLDIREAPFQAHATAIYTFSGPPRRRWLGRAPRGVRPWTKVVLLMEGDATRPGLTPDAERAGGL